MQSRPPWDSSVGLALLFDMRASHFLSGVDSGYELSFCVSTSNVTISNNLGEKLESEYQSVKIKVQNL